MMLLLFCCTHEKKITEIIISMVVYLAHNFKVAILFITRIDNLEVENFPPFFFEYKRAL